MHIHRTNRTTVLLRESFRQGGRVKKRTLANISAWSDDQIAYVEKAIRIRQAYPDTPVAEEAAKGIYTVLVQQMPSRWMTQFENAVTELSLKKGARALNSDHQPLSAGHVAGLLSRTGGTHVSPMNVMFRSV